MLFVVNGQYQLINRVATRGRVQRIAVDTGVRKGFASPNIGLTIGYCRSIREEVIRQLFHPYNNNRVATVNSRQRVGPYTSAVIGLAVVNKTLTTTDSEVLIHVSRIAHIQIEHINRVIVHLRLQRVVVQSARPALFTTPHIRRLRLADSLVLVKTIRRINTQRQLDDTITTRINGLQRIEIYSRRSQRSSRSVTLQPQIRTLIIRLGFLADIVGLMPRVVYHNNRVATIHGLQRVAICPRLRVFLMIELYRITRTVLDKRIPLVNRTNINRQVIDTVVMVMRLEWLDIRALHFDVLTVNLAQTVTPRIR